MNAFGKVLREKMDARGVADTGVLAGMIAGGAADRDGGARVSGEDLRREIDAATTRDQPGDAALGPHVLAGIRAALTLEDGEFDDVLWAYGTDERR